MRSAALIGTLLATLGGCVGMDRTVQNSPAANEFASTPTAPVVRSFASAVPPKPPAPPPGAMAAKTTPVTPPVYVVLQPGESGGLPAAQAHINFPINVPTTQPTLPKSDGTIVVQLPNETPPAPPMPPSQTFAAATDLPQSSAPATLPPIEPTGPVLAEAPIIAPTSDGPQLLQSPVAEQTATLAMRVDTPAAPDVSKPQSLEELTRRRLSANVVNAVAEVGATTPAASLIGAVEPDKATLASRGPMLGKHEPKIVDATPARGSPICDESELKIVNSKRISLQYELNGAASADVAGVELWCTRDGRTWMKRDMQPPTAQACTVEVDSEDLFGLSLVVRNVNGMGRTPANGDKPQVWVEVDLTKPTVRLMGIEAEKEAAGRRYTVRWRAADKNLGAKPMSLSYAWQPDGPWTPIIARIENTGSYVWAAPFDAPSRLYVRIEATDVAGNVGYAQTPDPLEDLSPPPTATIRTVEAID